MTECKALYVKTIKPQNTGVKGKTMFHRRLAQQNINHLTSEEQ